MGKSKKMMWSKPFPMERVGEDNDDGGEEEEEGKWEREGEREGDREKIELKELAARAKDYKGAFDQYCAINCTHSIVCMLLQ